ncbi:MAG: hypothetical protein F6K58_31935, partial [Symploca sp. SIO2E9]|nr:hypothetical protein [Symploca sp. SIO2E9]
MTEGRGEGERGRRGEGERGRRGEGEKGRRGEGENFIYKYPTTPPTLPTPEEN